MSDLIEQKQRLIRAFLQDPTTYTITVKDPTSLPKKLAGKKEVQLTIYPPVINTLQKCSKLTLQLPKEVLEDPNDQLLINHIETIAKTVAIMVHGTEQGEPPEWIATFLLENTTAMELLNIFKELQFKTGTGFFLTCFQILTINPMLMAKQSQSDSIHTD